MPSINDGGPTDPETKEKSLDNKQFRQQTSRIFLLHAFSGHRNSPHDFISIF